LISPGGNGTTGAKSDLFSNTSRWIPNAIIKTKKPPRPPNVTNTTQLPDTSPLDREGADSQVDTKSVKTDLWTEKIEKDTEPVSPSPTPTAERLHIHTVIESSESESSQKTSLVEETENWIRVWQWTEFDLVGQDRRPLNGDEEPLQEIVNTSPEGQSKRWSSTTPARQSTSKEVSLEVGVESKEEATETDLSLCCNITLTKQSTPLLTLQGELPNDINNGKDKGDMVTLSLELVSFLSMLLVDGLVRVSEMDICKGKTNPELSWIDWWEETLSKDSRAFSGIESVNDEVEGLVEEECQEGRKNEEVRR
jgi:hypothetical protein